MHFFAFLPLCEKKRSLGTRPESRLLPRFVNIGQPPELMVVELQCNSD